MLEWLIKFQKMDRRWVFLGMALAIMLNMGTITVPGGFPVVATFLASSLDLPFEGTAAARGTLRRLGIVGRSGSVNMAHLC